jgi:hypothetical protein
MEKIPELTWKQLMFLALMLFAVYLLLHIIVMLLLLILKAIFYGVITYLVFRALFPDEPNYD